MLALGACAGLMLAPAARAQTSADLSAILQRLDRLEEQNRALLEEVRSLRQELAAYKAQEAPPAPQAAVEEKVDVAETRISELAQTKVEASHRFPIRLTGMALFNTFLNSRGDGYPTVAARDAMRSAGATFRQTMIGLDYRGPETFWNGKVRGSVFMDFFGGSGRVLDETVRLRTAVIGVDWNSRSVEAGIEKPLISPRDPNSLAQVGIAPLSGAGNLWLWIPQVRAEQRLRLGAGSQLRAQAAVVQTSEGSPESTPEDDPGYQPAVEGRRPGIEARLEFSHGEDRRIEIAPGFHRSVSHVAGTAVPSNIYSLDWYARPLTPLEFTGMFFKGQNVAPLGTGAYRQGFSIYGRRDVRPVRSYGGWAQLTVRATQRLSFNFFSGQQDDRDADLDAGAVGKNLAYGANVFIRLAPNVLLSFESSQLRTNYLGAHRQLNNHYDLGVAYLF